MLVLTAFSLLIVKSNYAQNIQQDSLPSFPSAVERQLNNIDRIGNDVDFDLSESLTQSCFVFGEETTVTYGYL